MALSFLKNLFAEPVKEPTRAQIIEEARLALLEGNIQPAIDLAKDSFKDFEDVTGQVNNEAAFDAKLVEAQKLFVQFENCPQDHPNEFNKFGKSIQYCTDALEGFAGLDQQQKSHESAETLRRMATSTYFNHKNFENRVTQSPQAPKMVTILNAHQMLANEEHLELVMDKNQDEDFKIAFLKTHIKRMDNKDRVLYLEDIARTEGAEPTKLQTWALNEYARQCDTEVHHHMVPFILSEIQAGSVETAKKFFPDVQSLKNFCSDLSWRDESYSKRSDIVLHEILPEDCTGKRAAEISTYMSKMVLDHVKLQYLSADKQDIPRHIENTHDDARLVAALSSRVLQDETAGHDAHMIAAGHLRDLIAVEDKLEQKVENLGLSRLDQHKAHEELRQTDEWKRYQDLREWDGSLHRGHEINEIYVRKNADQNSPHTKRGLELLNNGISIYGLRPDEAEEYAALKQQITEADAKNPHITDNFTATEIEQHSAYGFSYTQDQVLAHLQSVREQEGKIGYGRAAVESLTHNSDARVVTLLTSHKLLTKDDQPAPRFTDMQGQRLKL